MARARRLWVIGMCGALALGAVWIWGDLARPRRVPLPGVTQALFEAESLTRTGKALTEAGSYDRAMATLDDAVRRADQDPSELAREMAAAALAIKVEAARGACKKAGAKDKATACAKAIAVCDDMVQRVDRDPAPAVGMRAGLAYLAKALILSVEVKDQDRASAAFEAMKRRYADERDPAMRRWAVASMFHLAEHAFYKQKDHKAALALLDEIDQRFDHDDAPGVRPTLAHAMFTRVLFQRDKSAMENPAQTDQAFDAAVPAFEAVARRFGQDQSPEARYWAARALLVAAWRKPRLGYGAAAAAALDRSIADGSQDTSLPGRLHVLETLADKGALLADEEDYAGAMAVCDEMRRRFGQDPNPAVQKTLKDSFRPGSVLSRAGQRADALREEGELVGAALIYGKAVRLCAASQGLYEEERDQGGCGCGHLSETVDAYLRRGQSDPAELAVFLAALGEVSGAYLRDTESRAQAGVAKARIAAGRILRRQGKTIEAIAVYDETITRLAGGSDPEVSLYAAKAMLEKSYALLDAGDQAGARGALQELRRRYSRETCPGWSELLEEAERALLFHQGETLLALGESLAGKGDIDTAVATFDEIGRRLAGEESYRKDSLKVRALFAKARTLEAHSPKAVVLEEYEEFLHLVNEYRDPDLRAKALLGKAAVLRDLGETGREIAIYEDLIQNYYLRNWAPSSEIETYTRAIAARAKRGESKKALELCDAFEERLGQGQSARRREMLAANQLAKARILRDAGAKDQALTVVDALLLRVADGATPERRALRTDTLALLRELRADAP